MLSLANCCFAVDIFIVLILMLPFIIFIIIIIIIIIILFSIILFLILLLLNHCCCFCLAACYYFLLLSLQFKCVKLTSVLPPHLVCRGTMSLSINRDLETKRVLGFKRVHCDTYKQ